MYDTLFARDKTNLSETYTAREIFDLSRHCRLSEERQRDDSLVERI